MGSYAQKQESGLTTGMKTLGLSGTSGWGKICLYYENVKLIKMFSIMISKPETALEYMKIPAALKENWIFCTLGSVLSLWLESLRLLILEFLLTQIDSKGQFVLKAFYFALRPIYKNH